MTAKKVLMKAMMTMKLKMINRTFKLKVMNQTKVTIRKKGYTN